MKTKIIVISLFVILFMGCSKDDSPSGEAIIPANEKYVKDINGEIMLDYNNAKQVERIKIGNNLLFIYGYNGDFISTMDVYINDYGGSFTFGSDPNGHIISFTTDDVITPVTYNAAQNYYVYTKENGDEQTIFLNEDGDVYKVVSYDQSVNETTTTTILFETGDYKGTYTNTISPLLATIIAFPEARTQFLLYNLSYKPIKTMAFSEGIIDFENTFDDQGFLKTSTNQSFDQVLNFNYVQL